MNIIMWGVVLLIYVVVCAVMLLMVDETRRNMQLGKLHGLLKDGRTLQLKK